MSRCYTYFANSSVEMHKEARCLDMCMELRWRCRTAILAYLACGMCYMYWRLAGDY